MGKLHGVIVKSDFSFYIKEFKESSGADASWFLFFLFADAKKNTQILVSIGQKMKTKNFYLNVDLKGILQCNDTTFPFNLSCSFFVWLIQISLVYRPTMEF